MNCQIILILLCITICVICVICAVVPISSPVQNNSTDRNSISLKNLNKTNSTVASNVCTSSICESESITLLNFMDQMIDPCESFYDFACGKHIRETVLPEDKSNDISILSLRDKVREQLRDVLLEESQPNELHAFKLAKDFVKICMDNETLNAAGTKPMLEYFEKYGGWPVIKGENEWNEDSWNWMNVKRQMFNDGFREELLILKFSIDVDSKNISKYGIWILPPDFDVPEKEFYQHGAKVYRYWDFMIDVAVIYGAANRSFAEQETYDVLRFEENLAKIVLYAENPQETAGFSYECNVTTLQEQFPYLDWREYINWNLKNITTINDNETIYVYNLNYVHQLKKLLDTTPKRTLANYFGARLALYTSGFLNDVLRERKQQYENKENGVPKSETRLIQCVHKTEEFLPMSMAALYVRKYLSEKSRDEVAAMATHIHEEFIETLRKVPWLDERTRETAIDKANAIRFTIAYPTELMDDQVLNEYYRELELDANSVLQSVLRIQIFQNDKKIRDFHKSTSENNWRDYAIRAAMGKATYYETTNSILISASYLQGYLFQADRPAYMNYATIGATIGHEITHGFDNYGRQRDATGNIADWWKQSTLQEFNSRTRCFIKKYSAYKHPTLDIMVDGRETLNENIADVGGLKTAYGAYQRFVQENGPEATLPNLNYTQNQLYWISAAHKWCAATRPEYDLDQYTNNVHAPFRYRINGALSSLTQFANDFKCPLNSLMNPAENCEVW